MQRLCPVSLSVSSHYLQSALKGCRSYPGGKFSDTEGFAERVLFRISRTWSERRDITGLPEHFVDIAGV